MKVGSVELTWLGHSSFLFTFAEKVLYIDPYHIGIGRPDADFILLTHDHYDHFSADDIDHVVTDETVIVAPESIAGKVQDFPGKLQIVNIGDEVELDGLKLEVVPAYNLKKNFHPKKENWVGYIIEINGKRIYHAGDTDHIKEMKEITADVALLPISGTYTMTAEEAAKALKDMDVKKAVPMHWGAIIGDESTAKQFKNLSPVPVTILEKG